MTFVFVFVFLYLQYYDFFHLTLFLISFIFANVVFVKMLDEIFRVLLKRHAIFRLKDITMKIL